MGVFAFLGKSLFGVYGSHWGLSDKIRKARTGKKFETPKSKEMKQKIRKMAKSFGGNMTDKEVIETLKIARNTYFKYKREMKEADQM